MSSRTAPRPASSRPRGRRAPVHGPSRAGAGSAPYRLLLPVLGSIIALGAVAILLGGNDEGGTAEQQTAEVVVTGDALPPFVDQAADPAVGRPAPALGGQGFDGAPVTVEAGGRPMLLVFAAHWCSYCQQEIPALAPWLAEGGADGVDVVAVSTGVDAAAPNYPPSAWFAREGWTAPVLLDDADGAAAAAFGLSGYPFFVFIDADGDVAGRAAGALGPERVEQAVRALR